MGRLRSRGRRTGNHRRCTWHPRCVCLTPLAIIAQQLIKRTVLHDIDGGLILLRIGHRATGADTGAALKIKDLLHPGLANLLVRLFVKRLDHTADRFNIGLAHARLGGQELVGVRADRSVEAHPYLLWWV